MDHDPNSKQGGAMGMSYGRFAAMIVTSTVVMFGLMYLNTYALSHVEYSQTRTWMAIVMGAVMALIMIGFMWSMYEGKRTKVVIVATGSGIGPVLGHLLDTSVPARLVWVTKNPRLTYGDGFVDEIEAAQPDAMIWDTGARGKPDVLQLAYAAFRESGAEAVICVSNRTVTWQVVHGLEQRGIPAFGPIWDS